MGASDFDMFSGLWRLSLRHCQTSKFKLRHCRSLIAPHRRHRARCCRNVSNAQTQAPYANCLPARAIERISEPAWARACLSQRSSDTELRRSKSYFSLSLFGQSERFQPRGLLASGASFGFIFRHRRSSIVRALFLLEASFCPLSGLI